MLIKKKIPIKSKGASLNLLVTDNTRRAVQSLNRIGYNIDIDDIDVTTQGLTGQAIIKDAHNFYCIIRLEKTLKDTLIVLVHELFHATQDILENRGIRYKKGDANESYAYTQDYLFGVAYDIIVNTYKKQNNK